MSSQIEQVDVAHLNLTLVADLPRPLSRLLTDELQTLTSTPSISKPEI